MANWLMFKFPSNKTGNAASNKSDCMLWASEMMINTQKSTFYVTDTHSKTEKCLQDYSECEEVQKAMAFSTMLLNCYLL